MSDTRDVPLKYVASLNNSMLTEDTSQDFAFHYIDISCVTQGHIEIPDETIAFAEAPSRARRQGRPGDTLVSTVRTYLRAVAGVPNSEGELIFSTGFAVIQPAPESIHPPFLTYQLQADRFITSVEAISTGVSYPATTASDVARLPVWVPPLKQQVAIADFLDRETEQIDALITRQEELVVLLDLRRRSVLDTMMTEAQGSAMVRLKYLYRPSAECQASSEEVLSVYRDYGVIPKSSRSDNFNKTPENLDRYLLVRQHDLVVNKMKAWEGSLGISKYRGIVSPDYEVLRPTGNRLISAFAHYLLRSPAMIAEYGSRSVGIRPAQWRLYWEQLGSVEVPVPDAIEQQRMVRRLDGELKRLASVVMKATESVALMRERRAALISNAVAGRLDVGSYGRGEGAA